MRQERKTPDFWLFIIAIVLICIGLLMVFSASEYSTMVHFEDSYYYFKRQLIWALISLLCMRFIMNIEYRRYRRHVLAFIGITFTLLLLTLLIGEDVNGATRQISFGFISFTPSEFAKILLVIIVASSLAGQRERINSFWSGILPSILMVGLAAGLILKQPDLGTAVSLVIIVFIMLFAAGAKARHLFVLIVTGIAAVYAAITYEPYRLSRYLSFIDPWSDPLGDGFQTVQSLYAIGSGGLFGLGLGQGKQKLFYLPENHTDFIFSVVGEELGFIGVAVVLALFAAFIWRGLKIAITSADPFASLLACGITASIGVQIVINIAMVVGLLPVTGIPLPFISFGGTSLVSTMIGVGILLNISRYTLDKR